VASEPGRLAVLGLDDALDAGLMAWEPITYEDFLPQSAAGIFRSNLQSSEQAAEVDMDSRDQYGVAKQEMIDALGKAWAIDEMELYAAEQGKSIKKCGLVLGAEESVPEHSQTVRLAL
jgi:uncharacterized glyoxalase superfamily metalloenzyme YdcJ